MKKLSLKNIFLLLSIIFVFTFSFFIGSAKAVSSAEITLNGVSYALSLCQDQNGNYLTQSVQNSVYNDIAKNSPFVVQTRAGENNNYTSASLDARKKFYEQKIASGSDSRKIAYACAASSEGINISFQLSGQTNNASNQIGGSYYLPYGQVLDYKESLAKGDLSVGFGSNEISAEAKALRKKAGQALWQWGSTHYFEQSHYEYIMHKLDSQGFFEKNQSDRTEYCLLNNENFVVSTPNGNEQIGALEALCRATDSWKDVPDVTQTNSQKIKEAALAWAKANQQTFINIYNNVFFPDGKYDPKRIPSDMVPESAFTKKSFWKPEDLNNLYNNFFPKQFSNLKDEKEFTCFEKDYLLTIWKMFGFDNSSKNLEKGPGGVQDLSGEIVLNVIPADKLIGIVGGTALKVLRESEIPLVKAGVRLGEKLGIGVEKLASKAEGDLIKFTVNKLGRLSINTSRMFSGSALSNEERIATAKILQDTISTLANDRLVGGHIDSINAQHILDNFYPLNEEVAKSMGLTNSAVLNVGGVIQIQDQVVRRGLKSGELKSIVTHEIIHLLDAMSGKSSTLPAERILDEGIGESLTRGVMSRSRAPMYTSVYHPSQIGSSYFAAGSEEIANELKVRLIRLYGVNQRNSRIRAEQDLVETLLQEGGYNALARKLGKDPAGRDVYFQVLDYINKNDFNGALKYLDNLPYAVK